jgi:hypothetical protein
MKYKIIHLFVKLTNLFQSKIGTTKVNKIIFFFVFYYRCDSHETKDFTRFDWIIHDHAIHELYCQNNDTSGNAGNRRHICFFKCKGPILISHLDATLNFEFRTSFC